MTRAALMLSALLLAPAIARADGDDAQAQRAAAMKTAVTKGVRWLIAQQKPDGSWTYDNGPLKIEAYPMTQGCTALAAFTLLKCGIAPDEEPLQKAFALIHGQELRWTYSVGCVLLALEAKANFDPEREPIESGDATRVRKKRKPRVDPRDRKLAEACVAWLGGHQRDTGLWRYSGGTDEDVSNAQYALLGLDAAERMGIKVPVEIYERVAARLVESQREGEGKVEAFPVPGADSTYRDLAEIQEDLEKEIRKVEKRFKKVDDGAADDEGLTKDDHVRTAERKAAEKILESTSKDAVEARGWAYYPPGSVGGRDWQTTVNGSMTCSALAALFICKHRLERRSRVYERELKPKVDEALRAGAAWMAKYFTVSGNPKGGLHHFYYLYGLERAGVLGLVNRFGRHEWYDAGVDLLLSSQRDDGMWFASKSTAGAVPDTCFGLLFLARGTTPVVELPRRVVTGGGRTYGEGD